MSNFKHKSVPAEADMRKIGNVYVSVAGITKRSEPVILDSGTTITGTLGSAAYADVTDFAAPEEVDTRVDKAGDTMSGFLTLHSEPVLPGHAATKKYVDESISSEEYSMSFGSTRPTAPYNSKTSYPQGNIKPLKMQQEGDLLYVYYQQGHTVDIIDVSEPGSPVKLATHGTVTWGNANMMVVRSGIAFFANTSTSNIRAVDFTNITSFSGSPYFSTNSGPFGFALGENHLYVAGSNTGGVAIHDITNLNNMPKIANTDNFGAAGDCVIKGNYLFTTYYSANKLRIYDISNPISPTFVTDLTVGTMPVWMTLDGNTLYLADYGAGNSFSIVDVTNPASPSIISTTGNGGLVGGIFIKNNLLLANGAGTGGKARTRVYDISNKASPILIQTIDGDVGSNTTNIKGTIVIGDYFYMGQHNVATTKVFKFVKTGTAFLDTSLSPRKPIWWSGLAWIDATGSSV